MDNSNGHKLNDTQWWTLCALADLIVPPSEEHKVPGAGDREICKAVIHDAGERVGQLIEILDAVDAFLRAIAGNRCFRWPLCNARRLRLHFGHRKRAWRTE